ncbi:hypothetical protein BaRGS_00034609 [Batillaria attramentaria]|uniref:Uncharacterized protein n=1 Tax=Batillaria attramentaria TaxID=370345 RepID=A0ABD0JH45_9CAEN
MDEFMRPDPVFGLTLPEVADKEKSENVVPEPKRNSRRLSIQSANDFPITLVGMAPPIYSAGSPERLTAPASVDCVFTAYLMGFAAQ